MIRIGCVRPGMDDSQQKSISGSTPYAYQKLHRALALKTHEYQKIYWYQQSMFSFSEFQAWGPPHTPTSTNTSITFFCRSSFTNHDETSLQDYSGLSGSPFLRGFATVAWEIYFCGTRTSLRTSSKWEVDL